MAAEITRTITRRVTPLRKAFTENGFGLDDDFVWGAVEEEVVVLGGESEVSAGVQTEGLRGTEVVAVRARPH